MPLEKDISVDLVQCNFLVQYLFCQLVDYSIFTPTFVPDPVVIGGSGRVNTIMGKVVERLD
jgi:hypothetical protein